MSVVDFSQIGDTQPSPSIWADCPKTLLNDLGMGYFNHEDFIGGPEVTTTITSALLARVYAGKGLTIDGDDDTELSHKAAEIGGYLKVTLDGDDNDAAALFSEPLGAITKNSGKKIWLEARVELDDVAGDRGFFLGFVEEAGASRDVLADDVGTDGLIGKSAVGFLVDNEDDNAVKIVYRKDAGTVVTLNADATNATAIPLASRASLLADTEVKLGLRFDGRDKLHFYVNGYKVATFTLDTTFDQTKTMCAIVGAKTGAATVETFSLDWIRYAYQTRS